MHLSRCSSPGEGRVDAREGSMLTMRFLVSWPPLRDGQRAMHLAFLVDSGGEEQTAEKVTCVRVAVTVTEGRRVPSAAEAPGKSA